MPKHQIEFGNKQLLDGSDTILYFEDLIRQDSDNKIKKFVKVGDFFEGIPIEFKLYKTEPEDHSKKIKRPSIKNLVLQMFTKAKEYYIIEEGSKEYICRETDEICKKSGKYLLAINEIPSYIIEIQKNNFIVPKMKFQLIPSPNSKVKEEFLKYSLEENLKEVNLEYIGRRNSLLSKLYKTILNKYK